MGHSEKISEMFACVTLDVCFQGVALGWITVQMVTNCPLTEMKVQ